MFKVYGDNYFKGWVLVDTVKTIEDTSRVIEKMDAKTYDQYLIIQRTRESDLIIDSGCLDRPKELNKRRK